ncbi:MAG: fluoride efflux transporter CrcB [Sphingomonas bacterium]|nr:fluoride efflux transporter CrcB [Sphingomonas bacterium]MDB5684780.1 fluoride efflux transporter CrcB [Sphingomonas bacterium]
MPPLLLVMVGGAIGAGARYQVGAVALRRFGSGFPWGTLAVNLAGGLLMGLLVGLLARASAGGEAARLLLGVGVLGGFTTFSAYSLEAYTMFSRGDYATVTVYSLSSVVGAVLMVGAGLWIARGVAA